MAAGDLKVTEKINLWNLPDPRWSVDAWQPTPGWSPRLSSGVARFLDTCDPFRSRDAQGVADAEQRIDRGRLLVVLKLVDVRAVSLGRKRQLLLRALVIVCCADPLGAVDAELSAIEAQLPDDYLYPGDLPCLCKD